jgi:hypothetical protein
MYMSQPMYMEPSCGYSMMEPSCGASMVSYGPSDCASGCCDGGSISGAPVESLPDPRPAAE